jgi:hypothetical protein
MLVEKKVRATGRHVRVANEFQDWLKKHPKANVDERIRKFNHISDLQWLRDTKNR